MDNDNILITGSHRSEVSVKKHYPELWQKLKHDYPTDLTWSERMYWYDHNITQYPVCPICGSRVKFHHSDPSKGYHKYCSHKCSYNSERTEAIKNTKQKRYGDPNYNNYQKSVETQTERYGGVGMAVVELREKTIKTQNERYGGVGFASKVLKEKTLNTLNKKYGGYYSQTDEWKERINDIKDVIVSKRNSTSLDRYGIVNYSQTDEWKEKSYNTRKKNKTFNSSSIETKFKKWLDDNNIKYIHQYRSEQYPFNCDFYFPDEDFYLEIQGSWTHGFHPYDPVHDKDILEIWKSKKTKYYNNAIKVWTEKDPEKRRWVKEHQLNWKEVFSNNLNDVINIYKESIKKGSHA